MTRGVPYSREELALLHETLSYAAKRTFSESVKVRLRALQGRLEERLLDSADHVPRAFGVAQPEADAIMSASETYCDALEQPLSAEVSRAKAARIRELVGRIRGRPGFFQRLRRIIGRG